MSQHTPSHTRAGTSHAAATLAPSVGSGDHAQGPADAPVTLVEYGDYQCPYCGQAYPVVRALQRRLGDRLRFVFRNFPLGEIHSHALHAAEAAESVGAHGGETAFWAMHDALYQHQHALDDAHLARYAQDAGADPATVAQDITAGAHEARVHADFMGGVRSGVNGTPTFFVDGVRYDGDWTDVDAFAAALAAALAAAASRAAEQIRGRQVSNARAGAIASRTGTRSDRSSAASGVASMTGVPPSGLP